MSRRCLLSLICILSCTACAPEPAAPESTAPESEPLTSTAADHVFIGPHILTMTDSAATASALAVKNDLIVWIGDAQQAEAWIGAATQVHELGQRALLPGFIDAHGHLTYLAATIDWANLAPPPVGPVNDIASLKQALREYIEARRFESGTWVIGQGYDDSLLAEQRHPTRTDLDQVSTEHPIALVHVSGHLVAANSLALAAVGINAESDDPPGGHIRREGSTDMPNGVLEETATYPIRGVLMQPAGDPEENLRLALARYAAFGITTVQDGAISGPAIGLLENAANKGALNLDVVIYPIAQSPELLDQMDFPFGPYRNRLRYGGVKLVLDGSPQGKTAYLSTPYAIPPHGQPADYRGYPTFPAQTVNAMVAALFERDIPVLAHANGDAAADLLIDAVAAASGVKTGAAGAGEPDTGGDGAIATPVRDHRTVMIHAQTVREDQLDRMLELGMMPSYFSTHTFFWGDWHRDSVLGLQRASRISPTRSSLDRGLPFTVHNDAPVVPPDMIRLLWATTNRLTRTGQVLGAEQRLTTIEALAAMTRDAAYQYFEEDRKGTLETGKLADLVILSANPLDMDTGDLLSLEVDETWSHGQRVF